MAFIPGGGLPESQAAPGIQSLLTPNTQGHECRKMKKV